jgi:hypothetical protein
MKPEAVYYERELGSSLTWLILALFLGGCPLAVYYTSPEPDRSQVLLAAALGLPVLALSIRDLGISRALFLDPLRLQLNYVFTRRKTEVHSYTEVRDLHLIRGTRNPQGQARHSWCLILTLAGERQIVMEYGSLEEAERCAGYLGRVFAVQPRMTPVLVPLPDPDPYLNP